MLDKHNRHIFFYYSNHSAYIIYRVKIDVWDDTTTDIYYADSIQICRLERQIFLFLMI